MTAFLGGELTVGLTLNLHRVESGNTIATVAGVEPRVIDGASHHEAGEVFLHEGHHHVFLAVAIDVFSGEGDRLSQVAHHAFGREAGATHTAVGVLLINLRCIEVIVAQEGELDRGGALRIDGVSQNHNLVRSDFVQVSLDGALCFLQLSHVVAVQNVQSVILGDLHSSLGLFADTGLFVGPLFFQVFDDVEVVIAVITLEFQRVGVVDEGGGSPFGGDNRNDSPER